MSAADMERIEAIRKWYLTEPKNCDGNFLLSQLSALSEALSAAQRETEDVRRVSLDHIERTNGLINGLRAAFDGDPVSDSPAALVREAVALRAALTACQQERDEALAEQTRALLSGTVKGFAAGEAKAQEAAFKAGYHCQWHRDQGAYGFDPAMSPGDPDGAYTAWRASKETK